LLGSLQCVEWPGDDHVHAGALQLCRLFWHHLSLALRVSSLDYEGAPFDIAKLAHPLAERVHGRIIGRRITTRHPADPRGLRRLRRHSERECDRRASNNSDEIAAQHFSLPREPQDYADPFEHVTSYYALWSVWNDAQRADAARTAPAHQGMYAVDLLTDLSCADTPACLMWSSK